MSLISSIMPLDSFDFSSKIELGKSFIAMVGLTKWDDALYTPIYWVYYADAFALITELAVAAWVMYKAVDAAIHYDIGKYFQYADYSSEGNTMYLWDFIAFFLFPMWSLFVIVFSLIYAGWTW